MSLRDWKYYNHAVIPAVEPHEKPDLSCIENRLIWKVSGGGTVACKVDYGL